MEKPSIGRVVHYVSYGTPAGEYPKACRAAIVTQVSSFTVGGEHAVGLAVLNPTGMFFHPEVYPHTALAEGVEPEPTGLCGGHDYPGGTWHWPARV